MSDYGPQVKLARLYEKTSKTGNQYFVGRLGMAKVAMPEPPHKADGPHILQVVKAVLKPPACRPPHALRLLRELVAVV